MEHVVNEWTGIMSAADELLLPSSECMSEDDRTPVASRGIRLGWLYNFVATIDQAIGGAWKVYAGYRQREKWENIPSINPPPYSEENIRTRELVHQFVIPLTAELRKPLYVRIPKTARGTPTLFVSHTWNSAAVAGGHASLDLILDAHRDDYVWIDFGCYNQHEVESIATDMRSVIASIGAVAFALTTEPFFSRSWCLWEILCAHQNNCRIKVYDQKNRIKYKYFTSERDKMPPDFSSISSLQATHERDQKAIYDAIIAEFKSVEKADLYIKDMLAAHVSA